MKQSNFQVFGNFLKWFAILALLASVFLLKLANNKDKDRHVKEVKQLYDTVYAAKLETTQALEQCIASEQKYKANLDKAVQKGQECQSMVLDLMNQIDRYKGQVKKSIKSKVQQAANDFFSGYDTLRFPQVDTGRFEFRTYPYPKLPDPDTPVKKWSSLETKSYNTMVSYAAYPTRQSNPKPHRWGLGISGGAGIGERWRIRPQLTLGLQYNFVIF